MKTFKIIIPDNKNIIWKDDNTLAVVDSDITDRVKIFEDACNALGDEHPLVTQYRLIAAAYKGDPMTKDFIAYCKLRIIVAALNEGWEPKFEKNEFRYFPWFYLYTKEQYDKLDNKKKEHCVLRSSSNTYSSHGFVLCFAHNDASCSSASNGSRLAFKTRKLAEYAGKQFIKEYFDYLIS